MEIILAHPKRKSIVTNMEKVTVNVQWCDKNFGASFGENVPGAVVLTAKTFDELMKEAEETLRLHVEGMIEDGDEVPQWLRDGDYELEYNYVDVVTMLRACEAYASLAAISRATGINQNQLSHYATGIKRPRPEQRKRIVDGLHHIGRRLMAVV